MTATQATVRPHHSNIHRSAQPTMPPSRKTPALPPSIIRANA
jgi:hypothetical protein